MGEQLERSHNVVPKPQVPDELITYYGISIFDRDT